MIVKTARKNIFHKPLNAILSIVLLASGVAIISLLLSLQNQFENTFSRNLKGTDLVMGAKGSPLQIILSALYQIDNPTGNIKYNEAKRWMKHPFVKEAIPLAYGDSYMGYNIVGTETSYINKHNATLQKGKLFENVFEVVVGNKIAKKLNLEIGFTFYGNHGLVSNDEETAHTNHQYKIVGILNATETVIDNLILCNNESVWAMHEEEEEHHHHDAEDETEHVHSENEKEITAVLFEFKNKMAIIQWPRLINENTNMIIASPAIEINRLFSLFGIGFETLQYLAWGIIIISFLSIFISLYNRLKERKVELALIRTAGATKFQVFVLVLVESLWLCVIGFITGFIAGKFSLYLISSATEEQLKLSFTAIKFIEKDEVLLFLLIIILGFAAALIPAIKAYRMNISKVLANA
jgi:putative ABC transport system permease protein